jgi:DNA primase
MFDSDEPGKKEAKRFQKDLSKIMDQVEVIEIEGVKDPGELSQDDADHFMNDYGIRKY